MPGRPIRSQGRTVDDQFVLPARNRRGAYVDVTRARHNVTIAYGQDEIPDFGRLMAQAQRDNGKTLVRDAVTAQAERKVPPAVQQRDQSFARARGIAAGQRAQREAAERAAAEARAAEARAIAEAAARVEAERHAIAAEQRAQREAAERAQQAAAARALAQRQAQREAAAKAQREAAERAEAQRQAKAARIAQASPEDFKRGWSAAEIGHYYQAEDEVVRDKDGNEYTIAEGWHPVCAAVTLDGDELRHVGVVFAATSDDGVRVQVPRKFSFTDLDEGVDEGIVEIHDDYLQRFGLATVRAADREAPKRAQRDFAQAYEIRGALERAGMSSRDLPDYEALMKQLPDLRKRAANVEREPFTFPSEAEKMAKLVRDDLGHGRSRGMHR